MARTSPIRSSEQRLNPDLVVYCWTRSRSEGPTIIGLPLSPKRSAFPFLSLAIVTDFIQLLQPSERGTIAGQGSSGSRGAGTIVDVVSFPSCAARHPFPFHITPSPGSLTSPVGVFQAVDLLLHRPALKDNAGNSLVQRTAGARCLPVLAGQSLQGKTALTPVLGRSLSPLLSFLTVFLGLWSSARPWTGTRTPLW